MNLHTVQVRPGIRTSERFGRLGMGERDLFYGLLSAANQKEGWFEANATVLRCALYAPCLGKVSERDVKDGLLKLREVGLIKLWTGKNGRAYGQIVKYEQRFDYGAALPPDAHPPDDDELALTPADPVPIGKKSRDEGRGVEFARRARKPTPAPTHELQEDWSARLAAAWPGINILAELEAAKKKKGGRVERDWFEAHWLPKVSPAVQFGGGGKAAPIEPEPEAWGVWLETEYPNNAYGKGGAKEGTAWAELPADVRAKIHREMTGVARAFTKA